MPARVAVARNIRAEMMYISCRHLKQKESPSHLEASEKKKVDILIHPS